MGADVDDMFSTLIPILAPILASYGETLTKKQAAELALRCAAAGVAAGSQMLNSMIQANLLLGKMKC